MKKRRETDFHGITHGVRYRSLDKWVREQCSKNRHAFDEVWSLADHYLHCDGCGLVVGIAYITGPDAQGDE